MKIEKMSQKLKKKKKKEKKKNDKARMRAVDNDKVVSFQRKRKRN